MLFFVNRLTALAMRHKSFYQWLIVSVTVLKERLHDIKLQVHDRDDYEQTFQPNVWIEPHNV